MLDIDMLGGVLGHDNEQFCCFTRCLPSQQVGPHAGPTCMKKLGKHLPIPNDVSGWSEFYEPLLVRQVLSIKFNLRFWQPRWKWIENEEQRSFSPSLFFMSNPAKPQQFLIDFFYYYKND